jgi:NADPH-dependent ferric siderophore reductase
MIVNQGAAVRREMEALFQYYNDYHPDSVLFIALYVVGKDFLSDAEIIDFSNDSITILIEQEGRKAEVVHKLNRTVNSRDDVSASFYQLLQCARESAGNSVPLTSAEEAQNKTVNLKTYRSVVSATRQITPYIREITLKGEFTAFQNPGWDAYVFVMVPEIGEVLPPDFSLAMWRSLQGSEKPAAAYYSIRTMREDEMDLWFVVHDTCGAVSEWARNASPGDEVAIWGPGTMFDPPALTSNYLLFGDETATPAIAAILDQLPTDVTVTAVLETESDDGVIPLRCPPNWAVHWVFRNGLEPGRVALIEEQMEKLEIDPAGLYVFGAAEASQISGIRKLVKHRWAPGKQRMHVSGYWRLLS